jgi:hypothetical protein
VSIHDDIRDFKARCEAMREERASQWGDIVIELPPKASEESAKTPTETQSERELRERAEQRRVALSAGGQLVRRLGDSKF